MTTLCAECGKRAVVRLAVAGRRSPFKNFRSLEIPADVEIPTCSNCGTEWIDEKTAARVDAALAEAAAVKLKELARAALDVVSATINQRDLEIQLGLSAGYLSKVKHGKETPSATLVGLLGLLAASPKRLAQIDHLWSKGILPPRITTDHVARNTITPEPVVSDAPVSLAT
jgi:hypothetical protein